MTFSEKGKSFHDPEYGRDDNEKEEHLKNVSIIMPCQSASCNQHSV